ncbi:MAG TPA: FtsX-like permease family protein [Ktedonobacteraceae bacterium]|nr:FtsX-like permease family protein [Ktedonobacteraceae bacterium]
MPHTCTKTYPRKPHPRGNNPFNSAITLSLWQLRRTWRFLLLIAVGILTAVVLVCLVPLYSSVAISAGFRDALKTAPSGPYVIVHSTAAAFSPYVIQRDESQVDAEAHFALGQYIDGPQVISIRNSLPLYELQSRAPRGKSMLLLSKDQLALLGFPISQASQHLQLLQGRLPLDAAHTLEIAITPRAAALLHLTTGSTIFTQFAYDIHLNYYPYNEAETLKLPLHIVGIFTASSQNDPFWHGETFAPGPLAQTSPSAAEQPERYPALVPNQAMLTVINQMLSAAIAPLGSGLTVPDLSLAFPFDLYSYYALDTTRLDIHSIDDFNSRLNAVVNDLSNYPFDPPFFDQTSTIAPLDALAGYSSRITVISAPLGSLTYLIAGLILFFVSIMTTLLVDRQQQAVALLRSRGASRRQVFAALIVQSLAVALLALLIGPFLAILVASIMTLATLTPGDQTVVSLITQNPLQAAWGLRWPALLIIAISMLAMALAIIRAVRIDMLALGRESARSSHRPFWQRMRLDLAAVLVAIVGFAFSLYITTPGVLDDHVRALILPATTVVGALFFLLACALLLLRFFPSILRLASSLASRSRRAIPMLALANMARSPHQAFRITTLLVLAIAFATFTLSFTASQTQRIPDVVAYQVGSDFSGSFAIGNIASFNSWQQQEAIYRHIPGVTSVTIGYANLVPATAGSFSSSIDMRIVDAATYAHTTYWTSQDSSQPVTSLMQQLIAARSLVATQKVVPAIVDAAAASQLDLSVGSRFTINDTNTLVNVLVIAQVAYIPTIYDSPYARNTTDSSVFGGLLADFQSYSGYFSATSDQSITPTTIWLRTHDDPAALSSVRAALSAGPLQLINLSDRRAIISSLSNDPLYLTLIVVLRLGAATVILLALVGNLALAWQSARRRLPDFVILRALGSTPREIATLLACEQSIIYIVSIALGIATGLIFSAIVLPRLVFTTIINTGASQLVSTGQFFILQSAPPVRIVLPYAAMAIALGLLVLICLIALGTMLRVAFRPAVHQMLRVSEDY